MKLLNLAVFLGLIALVGCEDALLDDSVPEPMPGSTDSVLDETPTTPAPTTPRTGAPDPTAPDSAKTGDGIGAGAGQGTESGQSTVNQGTTDPDGSNTPDAPGTAEGVPPGSDPGKN